MELYCIYSLVNWLLPSILLYFLILRCERSHFPISHQYQNSLHYSLISSTKCPEMTTVVTISASHIIYWCRTQCWRYLLPIVSNHFQYFHEHVTKYPPFWGTPPNITAVSSFSSIGVSPPSLWVVLQHLWLLGLRLSPPISYLIILILPSEGPSLLALTDKLIQRVTRGLSLSANVIDGSWLS